ncbi:FAD-binding protein [Phocaeicola vulgatus]|nr:FAD-binding protein [Phocaeicola vulgatus]
MIQEFQIRVLPEQATNEQSLKQFIGHDKGLDIRTIHALRILKRSIDARQRTIYVNLKVRLYINEMPQDEEFTRTIYNKVDGKPQVIVVGAGPGGLFAALRLIELGLRPVVVERGKNVRDRKIDIARISREHKVAPESNYSFGEGGAGAYSDGKLYTRSKKRGNVNKILNVFCQHGASTSILADAHPHIGTDKLPRVIENMRNTIIECGGEVHFETRMDSLIIEKNKITGIETNTGKTFKGPVILATGHSARDVYRWLYDNGIEMETKGIAVGVRLEHPSMLIDQIQYHNKNGRGKYLPAAEYSFVTQVEGRGVYSFCMCPGGFVVPAASGPHQIVVNGMSPSNRGSKWSNSGMVVEIRPEDLAENNLFTEELKTKSEELKATNKNHGQWTTDHCPLTMMYFQEALEASCWQQGNMRQTAPSQRMVDFTRKKLSYDLPDSSYSPGLVSSPLHFWMPAFITDRLSKGFQQFGKSDHGFLTNEAVMIGVETRTSAPVRILRDNETLQHVTVNGLFPCGEGAGYAGGIVSAGIDGEKCAEAADHLFRSNDRLNLSENDLQHICGRIQMRPYK